MHRQQQQGRQSARSIRENIFQLLLFLFTFQTVQSQSGVCDTTPRSWDDLLAAIEMYGGILFLCPFTISGDGCPSDTNGYPVTSEVYLLCEQSYDGNVQRGCVIDCPGTHFDVLPSGLLFLDGVTMRGSTATSVRVRDRGSLTVYNSVFERNFNDDGNGGAINAKKNSVMEINFSRFQNNRGNNGGGIFQLGDAHLKGSVFLDNEASEGGGGAIYTGSDASSTLNQNMFAGNQASLFGPAVFDNSGAVSLQEENIACGNAFTGASTGCDGISSLHSGVETCEEFTVECITPTSSPTASLSSLPTTAPSAHPSVAPSSSPISSPSRRPSSQPSHQPSSSPIFSPSLVPSADPSISPSDQPSLHSSVSPTVTTGPSQQPSRSPSEPPS